MANTDTGSTPAAPATIQAADTSLRAIHGALSPKMTAMENSLREEINKATDGGDVSPVELLRLQFLVSSYTVSSTVFSALIKETGDALKGVAAKIN